MLRASVGWALFADVRASGNCRPLFDRSRSTLDSLWSAHSRKRLIYLNAQTSDGCEYDCVESSMRTYEELVDLAMTCVKQAHITTTKDVELWRMAIGYQQQAAQLNGGKLPDIGEKPAHFDPSLTSS